MAAKGRGMGKGVVEERKTDDRRYMTGPGYEATERSYSKVDWAARNISGFEISVLNQYGRYLSG